MRAAKAWSGTFHEEIYRGGSRTAVISKMELLLIIVNGFQPLTIIIKCSILNVATDVNCYLNQLIKFSRRVETSKLNISLHGIYLI